jgi:predicted amino acid-binding ACT domain protein
METCFDHAYVLNVMSDDHPGIISAVSNAVEEMGGNIDSCSQTVLAGYFTLIMIVSFAEEQDPDAVTERVRAAQSRGSLFQVVARAFQPVEDRGPGGQTERFVITAFGRDKAGIVRRFSEYLAGKDINIVDLYGDRQGEDFVLVSQVAIPSTWDIHMLQADLEAMGEEEGFTVRLQHEDVFVATNQLRMTRMPAT